MSKSASPNVLTPRSGAAAKWSRQGGRFLREEAFESRGTREKIASRAARTFAVLVREVPNQRYGVGPLTYWRTTFTSLVFTSLAALSAASPACCSIFTFLGSLAHGWVLCASDHEICSVAVGCWRGSLGSRRPRLSCPACAGDSQGNERNRFQHRHVATEALFSN